MSPQIEWPEIVLRLGLTLAASALIGLNRGEHGHLAGLRTTILVCLAASMSMIEVNLLLGVAGKSPSSFVVLDLMRLPLGILSGMGFIGAGAILRKDTFVRGVTTAATLWFVTMVGLRLGGGQLVFGSVAAVAGLIVLWGLKYFERHWHRDERGTLVVVSRNDGLSADEIVRQVRAAGGHLVRWADLSYQSDGHREQACDVRWPSCPDHPKPPPFLESLLRTESVLHVQWKL